MDRRGSRRPRGDLHGPGGCRAAQARTTGSRSEGPCPMDGTVRPHVVESRRALVLHDRPLVVDLITLTLNHGVFAVRAARTLAEAKAILAEGSPHLAVVDMDHDDSTALLGQIGAANGLTRVATPVL